MKLKLFTLAAALVATTTFADVVYDENGFGFVGKGDIQEIYDWNNAMLQANHTSLRFRFLATGSASWKCEWYAGNDNKRHETTHSSESYAVSSSVAFDPRKNKQLMVTGFNLVGADATQAPTLAGVGECPTNPKGNGMKTLVPDSISYDGLAEPMLQVSIDGFDWYDLPITL